MNFKNIFYLVISSLFFIQAICNRKTSPDLQIEEYKVQVDSISIYRFGVGTYIDEEKEINLTPTYITTTGIELKDVMQEKLIVKKMYSSESIEMGKTILLIIE